MSTVLGVTLSVRGVRSLNAWRYRPPWPFFKKGALGQRKIGPFKYEKFHYPGQNREFSLLDPRFLDRHPPELHNVEGVLEEGFKDVRTGKFVPVQEMKAELVVPDLEGFKLRPYVSYKTDVEIEKRRKEYEAAVRKHGSEALADLQTTDEQRWPPPAMKPEVMFDLLYGDTIREDFKKGLYDKPSTSDETKSAGRSKRKQTE